MLARFPGWSEEIDEDGDQQMIHRFPSRSSLWVLCSVLVASSLLALISLLWQHTAAVAAATTTESFAYGFVKSGVGSAAIGLGWAVLGTSILALILAICLVVSVSMLNHLTDDDLGSGTASRA